MVTKKIIKKVKDGIRGAKNKPARPGLRRGLKSRISEVSIKQAEELDRRIREKAYEIFEQRGSGQGDALSDWAQAQELVMKEIRKRK